jgi:hypothetical protein
MRLLVTGCTRTVERLAKDRPDRLGVLYTPAAGNSIEWAGKRGLPWACDNSCFGGLDAPKWLRFLANLAAFETRPLWVACPDAVADAGKTQEMWCVWQPVLTSLALPIAFVLQDGIERMKWRPQLTLAWDQITAVFVGGSTEFKVGDDAARLSLEAHQRGKLVHFGRVNSWTRIVYLARRMRDGELWCDSIDGSGWSRWGDINIPKAIRWIDQAMSDKQQVLFGGIA